MDTGANEQYHFVTFDELNGTSRCPSRVVGELNVVIIFYDDDDDLIFLYYDDDLTDCELS